MTILNEIHGDHVSILRMIDHLEKTSNKQKSVREKGFTKLRALLTAHIHAEEEVLYRILLQSDELRSEILEDYEEHHLINVLLGEMSDLSVSDERWEAKLEVLRETLEHHIEDEEAELFPFTRKMIKDETILKEMGLYFRTVSREHTESPRRVA